MEEYTLLVMAAGNSTRFGRLKQLEPVGPNGEFIIDYSIYDAIKAGFNRVIFVIQQQQEQAFKESIGKRLEGKIKVEYVFQQLNDLPEGYETTRERKKGWGTAHAIYSTRNIIRGPFAIINADDFYGYDAYQILIDFLKNNKDRTHYIAICYKLINTLSYNGSVKRGIVLQTNGVLDKVTESEIEIKNNKILARPLGRKKSVTLNENALTLVNMFGFTVNFIKEIEEQFPKFLDENINDLESEYLVPDVISKQIEDNTATVYIKETPSRWHGITYEEDKEELENNINMYIQKGQYPRDLWD